MLIKSIITTLLIMQQTDLSVIKEQPDKLPEKKIENYLQQQAHFIILSPHLDDGVWSCGGLIALATLSGCKVDVITVYSGNPEENDLPRLQKKEITKKGSIPLRKKEDEEALKILGAHAIWWDIPTRLLRKPWLKKRLEVFHTPAGNEIVREQSFLTIVRLIEELINNHPEAILLCPLGAGHMYDHVELFAASVHAGLHMNYLKKMFFYEDSYAILYQTRKNHFLLKDYCWEKKQSPEKKFIWWRMMGRVMSRSASGSDIKTCMPENLHNVSWKVDSICIETTFKKKMEALSKYESQMNQFGKMKRVSKVFVKYHEYWKNCEPYWYMVAE